MDTLFYYLEYVCMCTYICVCMYVCACMCIYMCTCTCICMYVHICVYIYIYMYKYIYIYIKFFSEKVNLWIQKWTENEVLDKIWTNLLNHHL